MVVLRTSRFFPEADDNPDVAGAYPLDNVQANELLYRRADIADVVDAHLRAVERAPSLGFAKLIVSATTPFAPDDLAELRRDAPAVVARRFPGQPALFAARGWRMFPSIDRVYVNRRARSRRSAGNRATTSPMSSRASPPARTSAARSRTPSGAKGYHGWKAGKADRVAERLTKFGQPFDFTEISTICATRRGTPSVGQRRLVRPAPGRRGSGRGTAA